MFRRFQSRITFFLAESHVAPRSCAYLPLLLWRPGFGGRCNNRRTVDCLRSLERFDRAVKFVALRDQESDDVVSSHRAILSCDQERLTKLARLAGGSQLKARPGAESLRKLTPNRRRRGVPGNPARWAQVGRGSLRAI